MGGNGPVRQREFDLWRDPWERAVRDLQEWRRAHEDDHDEDADDVEDRRRWTWQQAVAAVSAAAVVTGMLIQALGR